MVQRRMSGSLKYLYQVLYLYAYSRETLLSKMCPFRKSRMMKFSSKVYHHPQFSRIHLAKFPQLVHSCGLYPPQVLQLVSAVVNIIVSQVFAVQTATYTRANSSPLSQYVCASNSILSLTPHSNSSSPGTRLWAPLSSWGRT